MDVYFSHLNDQIPGRSSLWEKGFFFFLAQSDTDHHGR